MATNISGTWTAVLSGGKTVYTSGRVTSNGPVNLVGSSTKLYVSFGASVSGMTDTPAGDAADWPNVYVSSGGSVISSTLVNVEIHVSAGASAVGNSYNRARDYVSAGGSSINETFFGTGTGGALAALVLQGGSAFNLTLGSGGRLVAQGGVAPGSISGTGGTVSGLTVQSGGIAWGSNTLSLTGTISNSGIVSGGALIGAGTKETTTAGASAFSQTIGSGATALVNSGGTFTSATILSGGSAVFSSGAAIGTLATVSSGGTLVVNGTAGSGTVNLAGDGSQLTISGTNMPTNVVSGWSSTDRIDFASVPKSSITGVTTSGNTLTLKTTNGNYQLNVPGVSNFGYQLLDDGHGDTVYTTCFAEGTMIATPDGEIAVEKIMPGTVVNTPKGAMPVKWLGHRAIDVHAMRDPEENWLIRICKGSLADNVPARDLLVTQEHCMVFDGKLVPARMLVNGASIIIDRSIASYTYYHVELDSHEAIWADGALTESYLDTDNRDQFSNAVVTAMFPPRRAGSGGSANLPLDTSRAFVEQLHAAIVSRAGAVVAPVMTTNDPDLHLMTDRGHVIRPARQTNGRVMFMIPASVEKVRLVSRVSRPSDTIGPFVDDRRQLGVLVGEVSFFKANTTTTLTNHLSDASLEGWHSLEGGAYRWTAGNATLPLDMHAKSDDQGILAVQIVTAGPYLANAEELRHAG